MSNRARPAARDEQRPSGRGESGSITAWFVVLAPVFLLAIGFVHDTGRAVVALTQASTVAGQAARKGVDGLDPDLIRQGGPLPSAAVQAGACDWAAQVLPQARCTAVLSEPGQITVTVAADSPTTLLRLAGVNAIPVQGQASASWVLAATAPSPTGAPP